MGWALSEASKMVDFYQVESEIEAASAVIDSASDREAVAAWFRAQFGPEAHRYLAEEGEGE